MVEPLITPPALPGVLSGEERLLQSPELYGIQYGVQLVLLMCFVEGAKDRDSQKMRIHVNYIGS